LAVVVSWRIEIDYRLKAEKVGAIAQPLLVDTQLIACLNRTLGLTLRGLDKYLEKRTTAECSRVRQEYRPNLLVVLCLVGQS
jgi:hypothetical protein